MKTIALVLVAVIAIQHFAFLVLEMFLWTKPAGLRAFGQSPEKAKASAALAANQGLYNGFLAAGLVWALAHPNAETAFQLMVFFLSCVLIAGLYGGYSVNRKIAFVQALPAALALLFLFIGNSQ